MHKIAEADQHCEESKGTRFIRNGSAYQFLTTTTHLQGRNKGQCEPGGPVHSSVLM